MVRASSFWILRYRLIAPRQYGLSLVQYLLLAGYA